MEIVKVWDIFIRIFHWSLAFGFMALIATAQLELYEVHVPLGQFLMVMLTARILYGFVGPKQARFLSFLYSPGAAIRYLKSMKTDKPEHYIGHNPAASFVMLGLIFGVYFAGILGMFALGVSEGAGPFASLVSAWPEATQDMLVEAHHILPKLLILLVLAHFYGIFMHNKVYKDNIIKAMIDGKKVKHGDEKDL